MADNSIEMGAGGTSGGAKGGGFQTTPGRAPGESSADFDREEGPYREGGSAPQSPMQNPMYIGGAVAGAVVLLLIIGFMLSGGAKDPVPPADLAKYRSVVASACEKQVYKVDGQQHLKKFMDEFGDLCSSGEHKDAGIESPSGEGFLLKAKGKMQHDMHFKPLTEDQKGNFLNVWKDKDVPERSYLIPLVAIVEADGKAWGLMPSPYLDAGNKGKTYDVGVAKDGATVAKDWESDVGPNPMQMTMEHWEKMTIRLSEDVANLLKYSNSEFKMKVSVLDKDEASKQNSLGKHVWPVKDGKGNKAGLMFGGVTDYLAKPRPASEDDEGREKDDAIAACKFFLYVSTQMVTPCRCGHDHDDHGDDHFPKDDCIQHFDKLFKDILKEQLPNSDADKLDKVCQAIEGPSGDISKVMSFEAGLLQHALEELEAKDVQCEGKYRKPENCVDSFEFRGQTKTGCVTDVHPFDDIKAPWCSWTKKPDWDGPKQGGGGQADWDGPWSFCVKCTDAQPGGDTGGDGGGDHPEGPGQDTGEDDGTTAIKALCGLDEVDDVTDLDPAMKATMNQIRALCKDSDSNFKFKAVTGSLPRKHELLVEAQGPLKTNVRLFSLLDSEKERITADGMLMNPNENLRSLLVPVIASFNTADLVWVVMPTTQLDSEAAKDVGKLLNTYKVGGITSKSHQQFGPHWKGFKEEYPKGLGISMEHWAKLIVRLVEDVQVLKSMQSISYTMEVDIHENQPAEDTTVKNALGKHVLRAYDLAVPAGGRGMLAGGVVDYLQDERLSQAGVSSAVYACEFLLFVTTEMFKPCVWPQGKEKPEEANCVTDFTELWPKLVKSDADLKSDTDQFLAEICQSLNDETNFLQDVGKMLEFVDIKLNDKLPTHECIEVDGIDGTKFRQPEHCASDFKYDGEQISGCTKKELFPEIKAPWCSWNSELSKENVEWDGPWSFCTHCPDNPETLDRQIVV